MSHFPATIKAITFSKTGGVDVIEKTERPFPQQGPKDIILKVEYAGVNFIDTYFRSGVYPIPLPATVGSEAAGVIVALPTDPAVLNHPEYKKRGYAISANAIAQFGGGTDAEYISVPWDRIFPIPPDFDIDTRTGAAGFLQATTVISFMEEAYQVKKGDTIFIHTIAGGFGLIATQYAKSKGATVIGTTSTEKKAEFAKAHGADHVILYTKEDTVKRVEELTNGVGVDAVFDGVGKDTFDNNFKFLKRKGTIVSFGNASGIIPPFPPHKLTEKNIKLLRPTMGNYLFTPEEGTHYSNLFFKVMRSGTVKINIFHEYPFTAEGVRQAQTDLPKGISTGKLIIKIGD